MSLKQSPASGRKILAVITARGGSKGVPRKNIKKLGGKPLIAYTIEAAKQSGLITRLIVSTDDEKIAEVARKFGADIPFMRPSELSTDVAGHIGVMRHATEFIERIDGVIFDYIVILQPTSPFRTAEDIDATVELLIRTGADSAVSMVEMEKDHPIKAKRMIGDRVTPYCVPEPEGVRRQDIPVAYKRSGAVYSLRRDLLIKRGSLFGDSIVGYVVPKERSIDIDTEFDWEYAKFLEKKYRFSSYFFSNAGNKKSISKE